MSWPTGWSLGRILITIVVVAACIAAMYVGLREFGIAVPAFVVHLFWICLVAALVILVIKFLLGLGGSNGSA